MLSRVAERVYWMSRYLERAENTARLVAVYGELLLDLPREAQLDWTVPLQILGLDKAWEKRDAGEDPLAFLLARDDNNDSLKASLAFARENTRTTRDVVPSEAWQAINELHLFAAEKLPLMSGRSGSRVPAEIVGRCHEITGILEGTMSHGPAYQFVRLGRSLERADMSSRIIDVAAATLMSGREELQRHSSAIWTAVLRALSAYQMYRQYVRRRIESQDVVNFLLHDPDFPRSVAHCVQVLDESARALPRSADACQELARIRQGLANLALDSRDPEYIHHFADDFQLELARLNGVIFETWLNPLRAA